MSSAIPQGTIEVVHIDKVIPYWRNPRRLAQESVDAVKSSIERYGYVQPIVVDGDYTIIIGHTRYVAMRQLGIEQVQVQKVDYLTALKVKQLRVIDNKSGEYAFWDFDKLLEEIQLSDSELLNALFPDVLEADTALQDTQSRILEDSTLTAEQWDSQDPTVEFVCPKCFHEWIVEVTRDQVMSGCIKVKESADVN